jgi:hypothetical protein
MLQIERVPSPKVLNDEDIERCVRESNKFPADYSFECGREFFSAVADYLNSKKLSLVVLSRCIQYDTRIFDNKPFNRITFKYLTPSINRRLMLLKKAYVAIGDDKPKDTMGALVERVRRLERRVDRLEIEDTEDDKWVIPV